MSQAGARRRVRENAGADRARAEGPRHRDRHVVAAVRRQERPFAPRTRRPDEFATLDRRVDAHEFEGAGFERRTHEWPAHLDA